MYTRSPLYWHRGHRTGGTPNYSGYVLSPLGSSHSQGQPGFLNSVLRGLLNLSASVQSEATRDVQSEAVQSEDAPALARARGYGVWWHWNSSRPGLAHGSATTVLARSAPSTVAILALRSHMVEAAGARSSWSARAPPSLGWNPSTTKAGAQRRLGEHGGLTYDSSRLVLAGPAARQLALRSYKIATRRGSSRARISRVVYDVAHDAG